MVRFAATVLALAATMLGSRAVGAEILLLDFWSPNCGPCLQMKPTIQVFEQAKYPIRQIDTSREPMLARQHGVERIPCFVMLVDNQEVDRKVGAISSEELQEMFARAKTTAEERSRGRGQSPETRVPGATGPSPAAMLSAAEVRETADSVPVETENSQTANHDKLLAATVRLRVDEAQSHAYGTGTIIDSRSGQALVITCGHLFRESKGKGPVTVELFEPVPGGVRAAGQVPRRSSVTIWSATLRSWGFGRRVPWRSRRLQQKAWKSVAATVWSASAAAMATIPLR